jgi:hypothetical protein
MADNVIGFFEAAHKALAKRGARPGQERALVRSAEIYCDWCIAQATHAAQLKRHELAVDAFENWQKGLGL